MTKLRLLHIAHDHPDWTSGGTEILAHELSQAMDREEGVESHYLAASTSLQRPGTPAGALQAMGRDFVIQTGRYDRFTMARLDGAEWLVSLGRVLDRIRPNVVHLHGLDRIGAEVIPAIRRLVPKARIILTLHDYQLICANDGLLLRKTDGSRCPGSQPDACRRCFPDQSMARHALRKARLIALVSSVDQFIAPSAFLAGKFIEWGIEESRVRIVPNARPDHDEPTPKRTRAAPDRFGYFGNVLRHKGILVLLDAAERLKQEGHRLQISVNGGLDWAGDDLRAEFSAAMRAAAPVARHLGPYGRAEVRARMQAVDWVVVPSVWWENAPLVIEEARAAGRPVIVSGIGGLAEAVRHDIDGLHVPPGDADSLAETLAMASADAALWDRLSRARRPRAYASFMDAHLRCYRGLREGAIT